MQLPLGLSLGVGLVVREGVLDRVWLIEALLVGEAQIPKSRLQVAPLLS